VTSPDPLETTFLQLAEAICEPCWILGPDALAVHVNAAFSQRTGLPSAAAQALGWLSALHPSDRGPLAPWRRRLLGEEPFGIELRLRSPQAGYSTWQVRAVPLRDGSGRWLLCAHLPERPAEPTRPYQDVVLRAGLFDQVHEAAFAWQLEPPRIVLWNRGAERVYGHPAAQTLGRDPRQLPGGIGDAERAELLCDGRWAGRLTHRTPAGEERLLEVRLELVELSEGRRVVLQTARDVTGEQRQAEQALAEQARSFVEMGEALLDAARVARGHSELQRARVALGRVVARALEGWRGEPPAIEADIPAELLVDIDEARFGRALLHLLVSTARLAPGVLQLSAERSRGQVQLRLQGAPFLDRPQGELDMSLSLARSLAELHGGKVEVRGDGPACALVVALPEAAARAQRILVVEDNEDAAYLLSVLLQGAGHEVRVANDPHTALVITETFLPDVAILDIGLPMMDGYELGTRLRAKLEPHSPQLIALSGYGQLHDRQRSAEAGFGVHLVKPVDPDKLLGTVDGLR
jgi:PAS domain S-box-containing protein